CEKHVEKPEEHNYQPIKNQAMFLTMYQTNLDPNELKAVQIAIKIESDEN
ncbi:1879_t:CDS:1, partial [Dentiscutata erythropus]